jgi:paraquat-inducible protein A
MIGCPDCGLIQRLPRLGPRARAECTVCGATLERTSGRSVTAGLACALGTLFLLFPANAFVLLGVDIFGMHNETRIATGVAALWDHDWIVLAALTGAFAIVFPFLRFGLLSAVLGALRLGLRPRWLGTAFRWTLWLDVWAMPDVYLLGSFVGYFRLTQVPQMRVEIHAGGWCFFAAAFLAMVTRAAVERRTVWRMILPEPDPPDGPLLSCTTCDLVRPLACDRTDCPRCGARLHARKPDAVVRAAALTAAAFVLFFPANFLPMNVALQMGRQVNHTIFEGIHELIEAGLWPLGAVIFCTSIGIPVLKIAGMAWFVASVRRRSGEHLVVKTKLHRFINEIGRWSNVDPFIITVFVPLMTFPPLAGSHAAWGSTAFILVVLSTLLASMSFDPRLMWDAAERSAP